MHSTDRRLRVGGLAAVAFATTLLLAGCATTVESPAPASTPAATASEPPARAPGSQGDPRVLGADTAPVLIVEFTDLQCPYCARFALETWPLLRARYVDTGKVRFASRDLPLSFHAHALPAAVAARCAAEQGRFFDYREALFHAQARLGEAPYDALAKDFGLDLERFAACRRSDATVAAVRGDAALAAAKGITATPSFMIGRDVEGKFVGEIVRGAMPFEEFATRIDALLGQAQQKQP